MKKIFWPVVGVAACLLAFLVLRVQPPRSSGRPVGATLLARMQSLEAQTQLREARAMLSAALLRDSMLADGRSRSLASDSLHFAFASDVSESVRDVARTIVTAQLEAFGIQEVQIPVVVVLSMNTSSVDGQPQEQGRPRVDHMLPADSLGTAPCISVVRLGTASESRAQIVRALREGIYGAVSVLGPCAFVANFGRPGSQVGRWLASRSYDLAMSSDMRGNSAFSRREAAYWMVSFLGSDISSLSLAVRACQLGDDASCAAAIMSDNLSFGSPNVFGGAGRQWGGVQKDFLLDLRRAEGDEKFARFWTSESPPEVAFEDAFGVSVGEWTGNWLRRVRGPGIGPRMSPLFGLVGLLVGLVASGIAALVAVRRSVA